MKMPPMAKVQKVCRTKGSGSSLQQINTPGHCTIAPERDSAFLALLQQGSKKGRDATLGAKELLKARAG